MMEYQQAQQQAIEIAGKDFYKWAVVYCIKDEWLPGAHPENRYLESYFDAPEIHICEAGRDDDFSWVQKGEWIVYKSPGNRPDYAAESGAVGKRADMLNALKRMMEKDD